MSDIVERLLKLAERERPYGSLPDALEEAAAEIERLRAALEGAAVQFANNNLPAFSHQCRAALKRK